MQYSDFIKREQERNRCGFCEVNREHLIADGKYVYATPALAPYGQYHLLLCPKRHVESMLDLAKEERRELELFLLQFSKRFYDLGVQEVVTLVRDSQSFVDGEVSQSTSGKSRKHFHVHVVGDIQIMPRMSQEASDTRRILSDEEMTERAHQFRIG